MMKEIHEQPRAVRDTLGSAIHDGVIDLSAAGLTDEAIRGISQLHFVACGSAYHVCMAAKYVVEDLARLPAQVDLASEFRYRKPLLRPDELVVIISPVSYTHLPRVYWCCPM